LSPKADSSAALRRPKRAALIQNNASMLKIADVPVQGGVC